MMSRLRAGKLLFAKMTTRTSVLFGALSVFIAVALTLVSVPPVAFEGWLFDHAIAWRAALTNKDREKTSEHVAVIALDQKSLDSKELIKVPRALFGPEWAKLVNALSNAGTTVIAFDFLFQYSGNNLIANYDRPFFAALYKNKQKVVLGRSARTKPLKPFFAALGQDDNAFGHIEVIPDKDEVIRRMPSNFKSVDGQSLPALFGASLQRYGRTGQTEDVLLTPPGHPETYIPTFSLIDVLRCAQNNPETIRRMFADKIVFVGTTLPEEDRKTLSTRYIAPQSLAHRQEKNACELTQLSPSVLDSAVDDVPGVFAHAVAAAMVLGNQEIRPAPKFISALLAGAAAAIGAAIGFVLAPIFAVFALVFLCLLFAASELGFLYIGMWTPMSYSILAVVLTAVISYVIRYVLEQGRRQRVQTAFGHYLAPSLVDNLLDSERDLTLGGRSSNVTIMFADLSGFTALSEKVGPEELVARTNEYLKLIADEVEATGGYVDKFIGDAVMAMWGAPVELPDHALAATKAAMRIGEQVNARRAEAEARGEHGFSIKIGLNSGDAVVGNVGSESRFNYTAVGEAVNIAARLEGLPGVYNNTIIVGQATADRIRGHYIVREIDQVTVKGKVEPLKIFEPVAVVGEASPVEVNAYADALENYRKKQFADAANAWERLADGPSLIMAERARTFLESPPPEEWNGVWVMMSK